MTRLLPVALLPLALLLGACGGGGGGGAAPPPAPAGLAVVAAFPQLQFARPVTLVRRPGDGSRWYVVEQAGVLRRFEAAGDPATSTVALDLTDRVVSSGELGLLGLDFHPDFAGNGHAFVVYTTPGPSPSRPLSVLARFTSSDGGLSFDPGSELRLLEFPQDQTNHNGGQVLFGPDGLLYAAFGDGGGANDPNDRAQDTRNLLGTIIRIDVDGGPPYAIPAGNPFAGNPPCPQGFGAQDCPEIYAWGLRNPWRFTFDRDNGELWAADVGQNAWEEVNLIEAGRNYGWPEREGAHCAPARYPAGGCSTAGFTDPVAEYDRSLGRSVTGGYVYRGSALPALRGTYLMGDYITRRLFTVERGGVATIPATPVLTTDLSIVSFAEDLAGEIYLVDYAGGLHRLVPDP